MFSFTAGNAAVQSDMRSRRSATGQAGNAMHMGAIGAVLAAVLLLQPHVGRASSMTSFGIALLEARASAAKRRRA
jgi:uncharacterized membrane protein HdeD (DUF308 family)